MRRVTQVGVALIAAAIALCLAFAGFFVYSFGWPPPDCGPDSAAVAKARALSDDQLTKLYDEMDDLAKQDPTAYSVPAESWPPAIAALRPRKVSIDVSPRIMLEGCFDHFVYLKFGGVPGELTPTEPKIVLSWGEPPDVGAETLWRP